MVYDPGDDPKLAFWPISVRIWRPLVLLERSLRGRPIDFGPPYTSGIVTRQGGKL